MSLFPFAIFLAFALSMVFGVHYFLYFSAVRFFHIESAVYRSILFYVLAFLAVSFPLAALLAGWHENLLTRGAYFLSGVWLGTFVNLLLAALAGWALLGLGRMAGLHPESVIIGIGVFAVALVVSVYGVWMATHPAVTRVTAYIPGLPEEWRGATIVQLSDVHIGHIYQRGFVQGVVDRINALDPKMVVITGDLFDGMDGVLTDAVQPLDEIRAPEGVYYVTGNHETYLGVEKAFAALGTTTVRILNDEVADASGLKVIGIDFPKRGESKDVPSVLRSLAPEFAGRPNIYLYHAPTDIAEAKAAGVDLQLSGHTHRGQQWPFRYITQAIFQGYDYGLHTDGDFSIYTSSGTGTWGPPMRVGTRSEIVAITLE